MVSKPDIEEEIINNTPYQLIFIDNEDDDSFLREIKTADAIVTADKRITRDMINTMQCCKVIVRQGIGFDSIDIQAAKENKICVCNVPDYSIEEVSEFTIALLLTMARHIITYVDHVKKGIWNIQSIHDINYYPPMRRSSTQILGIIGFGRIARLVAKKAKPFGYKIMSFDPYVDKKLADELDVELVDLDTLLKNADFVTINAPLTNETYHVIDKKNLMKMKSTAYLINTARGPHVCEEDLYEALKNKVIAGAALDVTETEPLNKENKLLKLENLIITPHAAFFTKDSFEELRIRAFNEAIRVLNGEKPNNQVNK
ncbi:hypothetical protein HMPREF2134_03420 [Peptoniphilus lacrimalis DNF00528]|nr:hypothetical protein HMPREF2134_03420 [Peptoniphilus lacrimalis DNF00528]